MAMTPPGNVDRCFREGCRATGKDLTENLDVGFKLGDIEITATLPACAEDANLLRAGLLGPVALTTRPIPARPRQAVGPDDFTGCRFYIDQGRGDREVTIEQYHAAQVRMGFDGVLRDWERTFDGQRVKARIDRG